MRDYCVNSDNKQNRIIWEKWNSKTRHKASFTLKT